MKMASFPLRSQKPDPVHASSFLKAGEVKRGLNS
jgi:hypothetical protein